MRNFLCAAVVLATAGSAASAATEQDFLLTTTGNLGNLCGAPANVAAIHMCQGYLVGVNHMHGAIYGTLQRGIYCIPEGTSATRDSIARDFSAWVAANPDKASLPARTGLLEWAATAFPCN